MRIVERISLLLMLLLLGTEASATVFTLQNQCNYTIWPATLTTDNSNRGGGFPLQPGTTTSFSAPAGWSGRFWARTGCSFDANGNGVCTTGDCGGFMKCTGGGAPPVSLAEFALNGSGGKDFYDVSLVDGYNVGIGIRPSGGTGYCQYAGCVTDLNNICPAELQVVSGGAVVACNSACAAFEKPDYCCTGEYSSPSTCTPTRYSQLFKSACPRPYSYVYDDDASSTCSCTGSDYVITFCPTGQ